MVRDTLSNRRSFLKRSAAGLGTAGLVTLAGCAGDDEPTDDTDDGDDGVDADDDTADDTADDTDDATGERLPTYQYYNNPEDYSPQRHDAINLIAEQFTEVGLDVEVETLEWGTLFSRVTEEKDYDFATWWTFFFAEVGQGLNQHFHSEGGDNYYNYEVPELDEILDQQMATADHDERVELLHDAQQQIMEDMPKMPIVHMMPPNLYNSDVIRNWVPHINGFNSYYNMVNLEVEGEDTISAAWPEALGNLNVFAWQGESKLRYQFNVLYDRLIHFDSDYEIDHSVSLATDYERPDDTTLIYEMRDHTFHDGEEVTAEDAAFSFNYIMEHDVPVFGQQRSFLEDAEAIDDHTVQINLSSPLGPAHQVLGHEVPIVPQHVWEDVDDPVQTFAEEDLMVGSGPLEFDYWDEGSEVSLVANDDHFVGVDFDQRIWRIIPETSTVFTMLERGDLTYEPFGRVARETEELLDEDHLEGAQQLSSDFWHLSMNTERLADKSLRQACATAVPRSAILEQLLFGFGERVENVVSPVFGDFYTEDVRQYDEGVDAARDLLEDAGYGWDDDGMLIAPE